MAPRRKFDIKFKEKVLKYAEEHSGENAAKHFDIDPRQIRSWKKQKNELMLANKTRARLAGGGRKKVSLELETRLTEWIFSVRDKNHRVSRKMIENKALEIFSSVSDDGGKSFVASRGWLQRFLERNGLSVRRRTTVSQKDSDQLIEKLVSYVDYVGKVVTSKKIADRDIIAMDETAVWFDMVSPTTVDRRGAKSVTLKTTGHEKSHLTVILAAKADGTKLKPYIVFKGAVREVARMQQQATSAVIATSVNGWMNDTLTADWLQSVVGKFNVTPRLLVWDAYRCHISGATKAELQRGYNVGTAVIPGGCTKYIQAPDVMWNQPFKQSLDDAYDLWMAGDADKEYTAGGYLKAPARHLLVDWVVAAWEKLDKEMIRKSFKVCGLSLKTDGSEDDLILCFREGQPCAAGREALAQLRQRGQENNTQEAQDEADEEELLNNELVVLDDDDDDDDDDDGEEGVEGDAEQLNIDLPELHFCTPLSSSMMQAGVCLRQDTETTLPELTEQHRIRLKEEELSGLESETECAAPGLNTLEPECVTAHSGVSDGHHTHTSVIKTEADLGSTHTGDLIKTESPERTELGYVTHLHPDQIKTETDDGGYLEAECISDLQDIKCVDVKSDQMKCESSESLVSDLMNPVMDGAGVDHKDQTQTGQCARETNPKKEEIHQNNLFIYVDIKSDQIKYESSETIVGDLINTHTGMGIHTGEMLYKCTQCEKSFDTKLDLNQHLKTHKGKKPYKCTECGKFFSQVGHLISHQRIHTGERPYLCTECGKSFSQIPHLTRHQRIHTGEKPYECTQCGKCFFSKSDLNSHLRIHTGEKPYQCTQCGKCFAKMADLNIHQRVHTGEKPYECAQCGKRFTKMSDLNGHQRIHTGEKPYLCTQCGKCFRTNSALNQHLRIHAREMPYKCSQCGKSFSQISDLSFHQRIHTGEKPYKCTHCGKGFGANFALNQHLRIHTGEKPYTCLQCGKCFSQITHLNCHQRIHTGEKPYKCPQCGKRFSQVSNLICHHRIHTGEKPYKCPQCGKCFSQSRTFNTHKKRHTFEKPFICSQCGKCFLGQSNFNRHQRRHSGGKS